MADLSDIVQGDYSQVDESTLCFETIPIYKIILFSILTLGIYQDFWFYKNWKILKEKFGYKVSPFWRAIGIKNEELFSILDKYLQKFNVKSFNAESLKKWYIRLPGWTILILSFIILKGFRGIQQDLVSLLVASFSIFIITCIISLFSTTIIVAIIQSKINEVNKENFSTVPINKLCEIKTAVLLSIGNLISCILFVLVWTIILYVFNSETPEYHSSTIFSKLHNSNNIHISKPINDWNQPPYFDNSQFILYQYQLGVMYEKGKDVPQDLAKACEYYKKVAMQLSEQQQSLDSIKKQKINIKDVPQDLAKACEYYKSVIKSDIIFMCRITNLMRQSQDSAHHPFILGQFISQQYILGKMYEEGKDVPQDLAKACEYYKKVAMQLCYQNNEVLILNRETNPQDLKIVYDYQKQKASEGSIDAYTLGKIYEEGKVVPQDLAKACKYYKSVIESNPAFMFWHIKENSTLNDLIKKSSEKE